MFPFRLLFVPPAFTAGQGRGDSFRFVGLGGPVQELFEFFVSREQALERGVDDMSFGAVGKFAVLLELLGDSRLEADAQRFLLSFVFSFNEWHD
jgi:hypothetical protein